MPTGRSSICLNDRNGQEPTHGPGGDRYPHRHLGRCRRGQPRSPGTGAGFVVVVALLALVIDPPCRSVVLEPVQSIGKLCMDVTAGHFEGRVNLRSSDEIGNLAERSIRWSRGSTNASSSRSTSRRGRSVPCGAGRDPGESSAFSSSATCAASLPDGKARRGSGGRGSEPDFGRAVANHPRVRRRDRQIRRRRDFAVYRGEDGARRACKAALPSSVCAPAGHRNSTISTWHRHDRRDGDPWNGGLGEKGGFHDDGGSGEHGQPPLLLGEGRCKFSWRREMRTPRARVPTSPAL